MTKTPESVEEFIERWLRQPGTFVSDPEREFIADLRRAAAHGVGYGWMQQIIEIEWRHRAGAARGPQYFSEQIAELEERIEQLTAELERSR